MTVMCCQTSIPTHLVGIQMQIEECGCTQGNNRHVLCAVPGLTCRARRSTETSVRGSVETGLARSGGERGCLTPCWATARALCSLLQFRLSDPLRIVEPGKSVGSCYPMNRTGMGHYRGSYPRGSKLVHYSAWQLCQGASRDRRFSEMRVFRDC